MNFELDVPARQCCVYFLLCRSANRVKIGVTYSPETRIRTHQTSCPFPVEVLAITPGDENLERLLHKKFARLRRHLEWFAADSELLEFARSLPVAIRPWIEPISVPCIRACIAALSGCLNTLQEAALDDETALAVADELAKVAKMLRRLAK